MTLLENLCTEVVTLPYVLIYGLFVFFFIMCKKPSQAILEKLSVTMMFDSLTTLFAECLNETIFVNKQNIKLLFWNISTY